MNFKILFIAILSFNLLGCGSGGDKSVSHNALLSENHKPVVQNESFVIGDINATQVYENKELILVLKGQDEDGDTLSYQIVQQPQHGQLIGDTPNLTYIPDKDYAGEDSFVFIANDGYVDSDEGVITIKVISHNNDAPVAVDDNVTTQEGTPVSINVLENDYDTDTNHTMLKIVSLDYNGSAIVKFDREYIYYSPRESNTDTEYITYTIADDYNLTSSAKLSINILLHNDAPNADNIELTTYEDKAVGFKLSGSDPDADTLQYKLVYQDLLPEHGKLSGTIPNLVYTPNKDFVGDDYITYIATDSKLESSIAVVTIHILPVNDAPVAIASKDMIIVRGDEITLDGSKSYDVDGEIVEYKWLEDNKTLSSQESFSIKMLEEGTYHITLVVKDNDGLSSTDSVDIVVNPCCKGCNYPDPTQTNPFN
jgi:hypothetical protein